MSAHHPHCTVGWVDCNGRTTFHAEPVGAVALAVLPRSDGTEHVSPICDEHKQTLLNSTSHHDPHCRHYPRDPSKWFLRPLPPE